MKTLRARAPRATVGAGICAVLSLTALACSQLTNVSNPDVIQGGSLNNPSGALTRRAGVLSYFATYFAAAALQSGLLSDELTDVSGGNYKGDQRVVTSADNFYSYPYRGLSQTRVNAIIATEAMKQYDSTMPAQIGELLTLRAYVELVFAETMCSGVPLATVVNGQPSSAPVYDRHALIRDVLTLLDSASTYLSGSDSLANLTRIARARSLIDSGNFAAAAAAVATVPAGFAYTPSYDGVNQVNAIFAGTVTNLAASVSDQEGINGLNFRSATDPRVLIQGIGLSPNTGDSVFAFSTYTSGASPIILASGIEGRLIVAESLLPVHGGAGSAWLDSLNQLRTDGTFSVSGAGDTTYNAGEGGVPGLAPLADPLTDSARVELLFRERAFWLFATGHRQGDLRRLVTQYRRTVQNVFPSGVYEGGPGQYGSAVGFVPIGEQYNPLFHACDASLP